MLQFILMLIRTTLSI